MREEQVTKKILCWLSELGWEIVCFDFPQSGSGRVLHPDSAVSKTLGAVIPDIVAVKDCMVVNFENKDHFALSDFEKLNSLRHTDAYRAAYANLLNGFDFNKIYYGAGLPYTPLIDRKVKGHLDLVDFVVYVGDAGEITIIDSDNIFG